MPPYTYLTPSDTARMLRDHAQNCQNMGLILARYLPLEVIANDDVPNEKFKKYRDTWLKEVTSRFRVNHELAEAQLQRWTAMTARAPFRFRASLTGRLIMGLGGASPIEVDILLDHVSGMPFIPGSALKGLARNYSLLEIAAALKEPIESKRLEELEKAILSEKFDAHETVGALAKTFRKVFGTQEDAGACVFYDAVAEITKDTRVFVPDVMTPHFRKYYENSGGSAPSDSDNPNPIAFLTVSHDLTFRFAVGVRTGRKAAPAGDAAERLLAGLELLGIGAKTASGYGVFKFVDELQG